MRLFHFVENRSKIKQFRSPNSFNVQATYLEFVGIKNHRSSDFNSIVTLITFHSKCRNFRVYWRLAPSLRWPGKTAENGQFLHHVQLQNGVGFDRIHENPFCSGSIIGPRFVLTAANCINRPTNTMGNVRVLVGEVDLRNNANWHLADKFIVHPEAKDLGNDIGVIRVETPFQFSTDVQPIQFPTSETPSYTYGIFTGWVLYRVNAGALMLQASVNTSRTIFQ